MKRILILMLLMLTIGTSIGFTADVSREKTEHFIDGIAGSQMWFNKTNCTQLSYIYMKKAELCSSYNNTKLYIFYLDKSTMYLKMSNLFNHLDEATISIIDLDNHIVLIKKPDGTDVPIKVSSNNDIIELFTQGIIDIDNPFSDSGNEQDIYNIKHGIMKIGYNNGQAMSCWGTPDKVNKTTTSYGTREQWVYNRDKTVYLYLDNSVVTGWQD